MRTGSLVLLSFLFINLALFANPFIGNWKANDTFKASVSETVVTVTVDEQGKIGVGEYSYTYDAQVIRFGSTAFSYDLPDPDTLGLLGFIEGTPTFIILGRDTSTFVPQKESMAL